MTEINFAAWNIDRASARENSLSEPAANERIGRLLKKTDLDFIFLQEVPDPVRIPNLSPSGKQWMECPYPDGTEEGRKCLISDGSIQGIWIPHPDLYSGAAFILTDHGKKQKLAFRKEKNFCTDPLGAVCSIFHEEDPNKEILRFLGFWNSSKNSYWTHLRNFLKLNLENLNDETIRHCIVVGDTNVNVRTENEKPGEWSKDGQKLINFLKDEGRGLTLINGNADQYTHRWHRSPKWFRCDLLMAGFEIQSVSIGKEADYMWKGKPKGSDHLPVFFSVPCPEVPGKDN